MEIYAKPLIQMTLKELFRLQSVGYFFQISSLPLYLSTNFCFIFSFHYHYLLIPLGQEISYGFKLNAPSAYPLHAF